ncbi:MAG: hypothetical protein U0176_15180 [Bacteroidia bacterium]
MLDNLLHVMSSEAETSSTHGSTNGSTNSSTHGTAQSPLTWLKIEAAASGRIADPAAGILPA